MSMKILACFKILPNPDRVLEEDWEQFSSASDLSYAGIDFNCFDQSALELSLRIREQMAVQGAEVTCTALTVSESVPASLAANLYATGFDEVLCIPQSSREFRPSQIADLLAETIRQQGADLVFTGAQAGMAETGLVPYLLARRLDLPLIAGAETAVWQEGLLSIRCRENKGLVEHQVTLPAVCAVGNSPLVLRCATLRARMKVQGRQAQLVPDSEQLPPQEEPDLVRPRSGRSCRMLNEKSEDAVAELLAELKKACGNAMQKQKAETLPPAWTRILAEKALVVQPFSEFVNTRCVEQLCSQHSTELMLLPDDAAGRALAVQLSEQRQSSLFFGGSIVDLDTDSVTVKKRVCGANLEWTKNLRFPAVLTLDAAEFQRLAGSEAVIVDAAGKTPEWLRKTTLLEPAKEGALKTASLVIACGSGMGSREACDKARQLAEKLGAGFGMTRPAALNGWGATTEIIGHSGSIIAPKCCLILGAAGAGAFAVGVEQSARILAVNTDPDALIFKNADVGLQMDAKKVVDQLLAALSAKE